jgi:exosome complex component RRP41
MESDQMGGYGDIQMIDENGVRVDGRKAGDLRPIEIELGVVPVADGSASMRWGTNYVIAAVYGPMEAHPRKIQRQERAVLDVRYNMAPFSTTDRFRPGFNRRSREISKVTADALESVVQLELFPRSKIRVEIEVICAEAGTRCVGLTAASLALADAGIPMSDMVVSVASGKVNDVVVCDLNKEEDNYGEADLPMGILPNSGELVFLQMDGDLSPAEFQEAWDYNMAAAMNVHEIMKEAIAKKYGGES